MADTFGLEIYASNKLAFAGRAKTLTIPAVDGEQAFLHSMRILLQLSFLVKCVSRKQMAQSMFWL